MSDACANFQYFLSTFTPAKMQSILKDYKDNTTNDNKRINSDFERILEFVGAQALIITTWPRQQPSPKYLPFSLSEFSMSECYKHILQGES